MVKFIVDSTFSISREYAEQHDVKVVNLKLILDDVVTDEGFEPDWAEFYSRYERSKNFPTTSQPNPELYKDAVREILAKDPAAEIIILTIANGLSGTLNSARLGAEAFPDQKIAVIDSQSASVCETMLLEELIAYTSAGHGFDETCAYAHDVISRLGIQFIPVTMKYLEKGGRIGKLSALVASLISVKPVFDFRQNIVSIPKKALGLSRAITEMIKRIPEKIRRLQIAYIHDNSHVPEIVEKVKTLLGFSEVAVKPVSPVFGIHIGIGAVGIGWLQQP